MVVPGRTVVCAVGDPMQAIYAFRGADPESMDHLCALLGVQQRLHLTWCYRCPRRIVFVAAQINEVLRASPAATRGRVSIRTTHNPAMDLLDHHHTSSTPTLFLARSNLVLVDILGHVYNNTRAPDHAIRWVSPAMQRQLRHVMESASTANLALGECIRMLSGDDPTSSSTVVTTVDRLLLRVLEKAAHTDGGDTCVSQSAWLHFVLGCLDNADGLLTLATVHAIKGGEAPHVVLFEFNLFGHRATTDVEYTQDRNLLYIALSRATESLTLLLHRRSQHIQSPFLPIEMVHYARELWTAD